MSGGTSSPLTISVRLYLCPFYFFSNFPEVDVDRLVGRYKSNVQKGKALEALFNSAMLDVNVDKFELIVWARRLQAQHSPGTQAMFFSEPEVLDKLLSVDSDELISQIEALLALSRVNDIVTSGPDAVEGLPVPQASISASTSTSTMEKGAGDDGKAASGSHTGGDVPMGDA